MIRQITAVSSLVGLLLATGCATYSKTSYALRRSLSSGDLAGAANVLRSRKSGPDRLLYLLENGQIAHQNADYVASNAYFEDAERLVDRLYTRSATRELASLVTNDAVRAYRGEPFELVFVNYYRALNYWYMGEPEDALVECRKANLKLARYASLDDRTSVYANDAFIHYLTGLIYEATGEWNDAGVSYRAARIAYSAQSSTIGVAQPPDLETDLRRVDSVLDDAGRVSVVSALGSRQSNTAGSSAGEVVLFAEVGFVPRKVQEELNLPIYESDVRARRRVGLDPVARRIALRRCRQPDAAVKYWLRAAIPVYAPESPVTRRIRIRAAGLEAQSQTVQDLSRVARSTFAGKRETVLARTVARNLSKYMATQGLRKKNKVLGFFANLFVSATEAADTRSWSTLPGEIQMVRLRLPGGVHDLSVEITDGYGRVIERRTLESVEVKPGLRTFLNVRSYS